MIHIPELARHEGSWVAIRKASGEVIGEFFRITTLEKFNPETVEIKTIGDYLASVNRAIKENKNV